MYYGERKSRTRPRLGFRPQPNIPSDSRLSQQTDRQASGHSVIYSSLNHLAELERLIRHCQSPEAGGFTPSDFPEAELTAAAPVPDQIQSGGAEAGCVAA